MSSIDSPAATFSRINSTVIRVPFIAGFADHYLWIYFDQIFHMSKILLSAERFDIFAGHLFQLRIRRDDVQDLLHVAVGVFVVDDLFEVERAAFDLIGEGVFQFGKP